MAQDKLTWVSYDMPNRTVYTRDPLHAKGTSLELVRRLGGSSLTYT